MTSALATSELVKVLGENPCPTEGCAGTGVTYRVFEQTVLGFCEDCIERSAAEEKQREHEETVARFLKRAGITPRLAEFTLDTYPDDEAGRAAKQAALRWYDRVIAHRENRETAPHAGNLLMYGPVGSGKTGLLAPIVVMLCEHYMPVRMVDYPTLLEQMKDAYSKRVPFEQSSNLTDVAALVLDDLGAERPTEWACGQLLRLVNTRYEKKLPTVYLSNYTPGDLSKRLGHEDPVIGERIVSRMVEGSIQHRMKSTDRRT